MGERPPGSTGPRGADRLRILGQVLWNLRMLGLFLVGPGLGVALVGAIFGLAPHLYGAAAGMFGLTLGLFALLARGEWRRLRREAERHRA